MENEAIRAKLQLIAEGKGDIPLFVAADMNNDSWRHVLSFIPRLRTNDEHVVLVAIFRNLGIYFELSSLFILNNI